MSDDSVTISADGLTARIAALGAELQSFVDAQGHELMWDGDPAYWTGRAPILFPIVGTLADDSYRLNRRTYHLPRHGFARRRIFDLVERNEAHVRFRLSADAETLIVYPFAFQLDIAFTIAGGALEMAATVRNTDERPLPASFGFHPALRWPLPDAGARADHVLVFEKEESLPVRRVDAQGLLHPKAHRNPVALDTLALDDSLFADDALIFEKLASRSLRYGVPGGRMLEIGFPDMPSLGLWTKPGAGYLCIEPWQGHADPAGFAGTLRDKPGVVEIEPGEERRFVMTVRP
ncbi:aldose 1-epimerase [Sphingomonas sp. DBB INV C78]|uniref:aldose 1-epimerase family protein n=1 Tax=Sphingomonas sp. DBB INV C78 TaxID=3349434 RepID=UPI0036D28EB6